MIKCDKYVINYKKVQMLIFLSLFHTYYFTSYIKEDLLNKCLKKIYAH